MCLLAILYRVCADAPVVVGANREEFYSRGGDPPRLLDGLSAVAGVDPTHGGTWLGANAHGVLVAVTNRPKSPVTPTPRSRGLLVRELLACVSATEAADVATRALDGGPFAGCNILCADAADAVVIHAGDWLRVRPLPPGIHVLSNRDVNDPTDRRVVYSGEWLRREDISHSRLALNALARLCGSHDPPEAPICFHGKKRGSVSSSLIALRPTASTYLHAQGPPDSTPYADVSYLLNELAQKGRTE